MLTVSEASKRDILHYFRVPESRIDVIYNAIDERFWQPPTADEIARVRERYQLDRPVRALRRQHQAAQEPRAADRGVPPAAPERGDRGRQAADHRRRDLEVLRRCAAPCTGHKLHKHVRFFGFVPDETLAALYRLAVGVRVSVALRGLRPAAARGDGERHAGDHVERLVAAGSGRRRGAADRSDEPAAIADAMRARARRRRRCAPT